MGVEPLDLSRLKVFSLSERHHLTRAAEILIDPGAEPKPCTPANAALIERAAADIRAARQRGAAVMLIYGAHLLRNGAAQILERLMAGLMNTVLGAQEGVVRESQFDGRTLPEFEKVEHYFGPAGMFVTTEETGWFAVTFVVNKQVLTARNPKIGARPGTVQPGAVRTR